MDGTYNPRAFEEAQRRLRNAPAELTDNDIGQLAIWDPALAQQASQLRIKALHPDPAPRPTARIDVDALADVVLETIRGALAPLVARIEQLEHRPALKFVGPYREGTQYLAGSITQRQGLWLAEGDTHATPGEEDSGWRLILRAAPK